MKRFGLGLAVGALAVAAVGARAEPYAPDNSGTNVRDRNKDAITAGKQSNTQADLAITQAIRQSVMADHALSTNAHNVKIVTANGIVTLRGPVKDADERASIAAKAQGVPGVAHVDNQLEIASH